MWIYYIFLYLIARTWLAYREQIHAAGWKKDPRAVYYMRDVQLMPGMAKKKAVRASRENTEA